jgi:hypothetical protein
MTTFAYRDRRLQRIGDALDAGGADPAVVASLEDERSALGTDDWTVTDRTYVAVAEDWLWATTEHLKELVDADPVFLASGTAAILSDAQATAIGALPRDPGGPAQAFLDGVHVIIDDVDEVFTELVDAAHHAWLQQPVADRAYPFDDVGVLLPLRLETLFDAPQSPHNDDPERWKLSLRVVPDEASIRRDDAHVGDDELAAVLRFWQSVRLPGSFDPGWLDGDEAGVAWATLSAQVTPARAAWLVAAVLPELDGESIRVEPPPDMPTKALANRVGGLPPSLVVSAITRDAANVATWHEIGRLPMDDTRTIDPEALLLALPDALATARDAWWTSWPAAIAVGLGGEWLLDDGLAPETLDSIHVVGIGDEPPDAHFRAQSDAGELGALRLGSPTNAVHGVPAASLATDADGWRRVARARIAQRLDPTIDVATSTGDNIERHLTGASGALPFFPGADGPDDTQDSQRLAQALWPALHGHWLADIWESPDDAFRVSRWAFPLDDETIPSVDELRMVLHQPCDEGPSRPLAHRLCPEGPLMPIRIGDQPYGLLPVTALSLWEPDAAAGPDAPEQQRVEVGMAQALTELRQVWAAAAHRNGTVVGVPTSRFIELLGRDALTRRYIQRWFAPVSAWAAPYQLDPGGLAQFEEFARDLYAGAFNVVGHKPETLYLTNGYWRPSRLPLIQPTQTIHKRDLREDQNRGRISLLRFLALVVDLGDQLDLAGIFAGVWPLEPGAEFRIAVLPDSLLIRLFVHVCQLDTSWLNAQLGGDLALPVLKAQLEAVRAISCELDQPAWNRDERDPDTGDPVYTIRVPDERRDQLERAMRATLDTAAHRIDPWITGFAWQRLRAHSSSPRHSHRLGAYGWLDGPFIGEPGPTDAGRLHAPSYNQALAALILRDKFLSSARAGSTNDSARNPWEMNISSSKARLAEEIADDVRLGFHIYEIVGRHVEDVIGSHQSVKELRTSPRYAMRPERSDPNEVCNGIEALRGLLAGDPQFPLQDDQRVALSNLDAALDTYGDLLMADGVMQLINRQTDRAAETMDAAAGFSRPPSFEFIRTPPSGYQLHTAVLGAVPYVSVDAVPAQASPLRIADPSLAAFVEDRVGGDWTWTAVNLDDDGVLGSVTIADLGLAALDTIGLSEDFLAELVRRTLGLPLVYITEGHARVWVVSAPGGAERGRVSLVDLRLRPAELAALDEMTLADRVRTQLGAPADSLVTEGDPGDRRLWIAVDEHGELLGMGTVATLGITPAEASALDEPTLHRRIRLALHLPRVRVDPPPEHRRITDLVASLGERPATGRDLIVDPATQREVDVGIYAELVVRYERLHAACQDLVDALRASPDDAARIGPVRRALSWGVTSISEPEDREALFSALVGVAAPSTARPLAELVETIAKALEGRLAAVPDPARLVAPADIGTPRPDQEQRKREGVPDGVPTLAKAIADLASPKGRYAVMACWPRKTLVERTHLVTDHDEPDLDEVWLTVMAAVRPGLARLEAVQLELPTPLQSWSSSPGNPWRTGDDGVVAQNLEQRRTGSVTGMSLDQPFVTAYGDPDAWLDANVAVGLIDAFAEAVPMPQRSTMTAFGFNAPAARAPQAILLAVPPRLRQRLDEDLVRRIVDETRELAHARTAHLEDLEALQALAPTIWLESSGMHGIRLDPYPLFT